MNEIPVDFYDSMLYISCNDKVVFNCDMSFERIDEEGIPLEEGKKIIKELWEKENEFNLAA